MFAVVDCNNFYIRPERLFKPKLEGKPVVVLNNNDGCIVSRSQEAKDLGIKMGTPPFLIEGEFKKHNVISFSSNYALYGDLSRRVMETIKSFVNDTEVYSVDEAFVNMMSVPKQSLTPPGIGASGINVRELMRGNKTGVLFFLFYFGSFKSYHKVERFRSGSEGTKTEPVEQERSLTERKGESL